MTIRNLLLLSAAGLAFASHQAAAQDMPDMKGVWNGTTQAIHIGDMPHRTDAKPGHNYGKALNISANIAEQEATMFKGHLDVGDKKEVLIGSVHPATRSGVMLDNDGGFTFTLEGTDVMHTCYWHMTDAAKATACFTLTRQK